jgi:hypothetical protein
MPKFTDLFLRSIKPAPPGKRIAYWDTQTGFGIRLSFHSLAMARASASFIAGYEPILRAVGFGFPGMRRQELSGQHWKFCPRPACRPQGEGGRRGTPEKAAGGQHLQHRLRDLRPRTPGPFTDGQGSPAFDRALRLAGLGRGADHKHQPQASEGAYCGCPQFFTRRRKPAAAT